MTKVRQLKGFLKPGKVYRREELAAHSSSVDRHLAELTQNGDLEKLSTGLYYVPVQSVFGRKPPEEEQLVRSFLKDDRFLLTSPNQYNALGVGTTQLYNQKVVYNHKRHGKFKLGNREFDFRVKPHFPKNATPEFIMVDLVNNLGTLAEDHDRVLKNIAQKVHAFDKKKLSTAVTKYGGAKAKKFFQEIFSANK